MAINREEETQALLSKKGGNSSNTLIVKTGGKENNNDSSSSPTTALESATQISITFSDLGYEAVLPKTKEVKKILQGVTGHVSSGQMLAILGPSGAGKTTMLDILAQRSKGGTVTGSLHMNGHPISPGVFRRVSAYVQQEDILHGYLTVRETIRYAAKLRLPSSVTNEEIEVKVLKVMQSLGIDHVADRKIGSEFVRGVSGGEKKRTAIAVELVTSPSLIFLDEPTTGLDTFTAMHLLTILKNLTKHGVTVVFSIHQPRSSIFRLFDSVLLLNGFGEEAYFGAADKAVDFMKEVGVPADLPDNPADFLLDAVAVVRAAEQLKKEDFPFLPPPTQSQDIAAAFRSMLLPTVTQQVNAIERLYEKNSMLPSAMTSPYHRSFFQQVAVVSSRAFLNKIRDPIATIVAIVVSVLFAVLVGSIYFQLGLGHTGIQDRLGVLFFLMMNTAFSNLQSLAMFLFDRSIYIREHKNGMYSPGSYYIGKIVQDVPLSIFVNLLFDLVAYYMIGLQSSIIKFGWFFIICTLVMLNSYGMCMFISNISKNYQVANVVAPLILVLYLIPSGFMISLDSIPVYWRWIKYISFFRYGFEAVVLNEFDGLTFHCGDDVVAGGGHNATTTTPLCIIDPLPYLDYQYGFKKDSFYDCVIITGSSVGVYLLLGYICLRFLRANEAK